MHQKEIELIDQLVELSKIKNSILPANNLAPQISFESGGISIAIEGYNNVEEFQKKLKSLYTIKKEVSETWSLKKFENDLVDLVVKLKKQKRGCLIADVEFLYGNLLKEPIQEFEILYELYGSKMTKDTINFGEFTVYNYDLSIKALKQKYPLLSRHDLFAQRKSKTFIGLKVNARESNKAVEIADEQFEIFENAFSYMISDLSHKFSIGIFNYRGWKSTEAIVCSTQSMIVHHENQIALEVDIEYPLFKDPKVGNDKIWSLITKKNKSEIEVRLINSIDWIGKAVYELDLSKALVQFVFAIEGMLKYDEKAFITPSIVSQLSDWVAFIIHDNLEDRKKIAKYFKDVYQVRSAIAHGAAKNVTQKEVRIALELSKLMITSFLTIKPFCEMKTMQELNQHLADLKFK